MNRDVREKPKKARLTASQLWHALRDGGDPEAFFRQWANRAGDPFRLSLPGSGEFYFTGSAEGAKQIFTAPPSRFVPPLPNPIAPMIGDRSLILLGGNKHRRERRLLTPPFHGERMRAYARVIHDATVHMMARWKPGTQINVEEMMQEITLEVIIQAVFGVTDPKRIELFRETIHEFTLSYSPSLFMFPFLRRDFFGIGPWAKFARSRKRFDELLDEEIQMRQRSPDEGVDILSLLLCVRYEDGSALEGDELRDELRTLLVAGHETSATGLAWALCYLCHLPNVRESLVTELGLLGNQSPLDELVSQPFLEATCKEAMRLHPSVPIALRRVVEPFRLLGHEIEVGLGVGVCISLLHQNPEIYENPLCFEPLRFVERKYTPFEYAPFGGGARRCIGAAFALYEMKIILGTLMRCARFGDLELEPKPPKMRSITDGFREPVFVEYLGPRS